MFGPHWIANNSGLTRTRWTRLKFAPSGTHTVEEASRLSHFETLLAATGVPCRSGPWGPRSRGIRRTMTVFARLTKPGGLSRHKTGRRALQSPKHGSELLFPLSNSQTIQASRPNTSRADPLADRLLLAADHWPSVYQSVGIVHRPLLRQGQHPEREEST